MPVPWKWRFWHRTHCSDVHEAREHLAQLKAQQPEVDLIERVTSTRHVTNHFRESVQATWEAALRGEDS
jgi:hypothetical protein